MKAADVLAAGLWGVRSRPLRTAALVVSLGMGIAAAVFVATVIEGFGREIDHLAFGAYSRALVVRENMLVQDRHGPPRLGDGDRLRADLPGLSDSAAWKSGRAQIQVAGETIVFSVYGVRGDYLQEVDSPIAQGRALTPEETRGSGRVCLVGAETADRLHRPRPIGTRLRIEGVDCEIVGVLGEPRSRPAGRFAEAVITPFGAAERYYLRGSDLGPGEADSITLFMAPGSDMAVAEMKTDRVLRKHRGAPLSRASPFAYGLPSASLKQLTEQRTMIGRLLGAVAALSIFTGVLAFAAISAASIASRRREIALRMAMGASKTDIQLQVFTEAMIVGGLGSVLGLVTGSMLAWIVSANWGWAAAPSLAVAGVAVGLGVGAGVLVGLLLAYRAASHSPALAARG